MRRLIAVCCALVIALCVGVCWYFQAPTEPDLHQTAHDNPVNPRGSQALWASPSLLGEMVRGQNEQGREVGFLLGSSELGQTAEDSLHPVSFFTENDLGFSLVSLGAGGYQSLWGTIETAALDKCGALPQRKIALLLGTQWFMNSGGCTSEAFLNSFSEEALRECLGNEGLSRELREKIAARVIELGVDSGIVDNALDSSVTGEIDSALSGLVADKEKRLQLEGVLATGGKVPESEETADPDWDALLGEAEAEGMAACTNNDYGIYDEYWDTYVGDKPWGTEYDGEPFTAWSENEFYDLGLFLQVCDELGIQPLLVLEPVNGYYYDMQQYTKESRDVFNSRVRDVSKEAEAALLDLSSHDYDKYYLRDVMHLGWKSWVEVDKALCEFYGADVAVTGESASGAGGETAAERLSSEAEENMLEVEGAGKEVFDGEK